MNGQTYIEVNYNYAWVEQAIAKIQGYSWLFEWGMYLFLLATAAIVFWIFFDSITKKKDQKSLIPRLLAMIGFFAIIPAFIFRFTGTADGVTNLVRLNAEAGAPYYVGPIYWNVKWLVAGYGSTIALIALAGMLISIVAVAIYASTVQRSRPSTEFVGALNNKFSELEHQVSSIKQSTATSTRQTVASTSQKAEAGAAATIFDRKPQAATIIDVPQSNATLTIVGGSKVGQVYKLPASDLKIGRDSSNYIVMEDGKASREHVKLVYNGGDWMLLDLGSANGTYLNDQQTKGQQKLSNGDTVRIGDTSFQFKEIG
ncbi:MAG: FHA domain-containing protein [Eggerthellaceae bacterium]|nr:FHA domain-containing protein [Eggerthellaceae bacterium]